MSQSCTIVVHGGHGELFLWPATVSLLSASKGIDQHLSILDPLNLILD